MRLLPLVVVAVLLTSCTGGGESSGTTPPAATALPPAAPSATIASKRASFDQRAAVITLNQVVVHDGVTTLTYSVTNESQTESLTIRSALNDGTIQRVPGTDKPVRGDIWAADGVYLVDGLNMRRYLPARDSTGVCVCTGNLHSATIDPGSTMGMTAVFRAVPPEVNTVDVFIPRAGMFTKVPVSR